METLLADLSLSPSILTLPSLERKIRMAYRHQRVAAGAFTAAILSSGCGTTASANEQTARTAAAIQDTSAALQTEPLSLVVQMTGLLLIVPPNASSGTTQVLMPSVAGHDAVVGFRSSRDVGCTYRHDPRLGICYMNMDGWSLEGIQMSTRSAIVTAHKFPRGAVSLTRSSSKKIRLPDVGSRVRAEVSLGAGEATDSCSIASWTVNPVGENGPERLALVNVLEWITPAIGTEPGTLILRNRANASQVLSFNLMANDEREVELLVMHAPRDEIAEIIGPRPSSANPAAHPPQANGPADRSAVMRQHFDRFYVAMGVGAELRRYPQRPHKLRDVCPITILGLEGDVGREAGEQRGVRTYSCIIASAEREP